MNDMLMVSETLSPTPDLLAALRRGSTRLFDTLGIPIDVTAAHARYAARIGKHPLALTSDESVQAILEYIQADPALLAALHEYLNVH